MTLRRLHIQGTIVVMAIIFIAMVFVFLTIFHTHVIGQVIDRTTHEFVVESLEDQIALLKWVGIGVITALSTAIGILWRTAQRQQRVIVEEVRSQAMVREEILSSATNTREVMDRLKDAIVSLEKKISECPVAKEWEDFKAETSKPHKRG